MKRAYLFLLLPLVVACNDDEDLMGASHGAARLSGCYRFDQKYFVASVPGDSTDAIPYDSTSVIEFLADTSVQPTPPGALRLAVRVPGMALSERDKTRHARFSNWRPDGDAQVVVAWRDGFSGPVFRLRIAHDSLIGSVRNTTDYHSWLPNPLTRWRAARAVRSSCTVQTATGVESIPLALY